MTQKDRKLIIAEILNRCWDDAAYKAQFVAEPAKVLADAGDSAHYIVLPEKDAAAVLEQLKNAAAQKENFIPAGKEIRFVQNSDAVNYIILPHQPIEMLTDEQLDQIAGGDWFYTESDVVIQTEAVAQFQAVVQLETAAPRKLLLQL